MLNNLFSWLLGRGRALLEFLQPILVSEAGAVLPKLLPIAKTVVLEVAQTGKLPNEKRDLAVAKLKDIAAGARIDVTNSLLNAAVELAYQNLLATAPASVGGTK